MPFIRSSISDLCKKADLTQRELAEELGVPQCSIYGWLHTSHNPSLPHLDKLYEVAKKYNQRIEFYKPNP